MSDKEVTLGIRPEDLRVASAADPAEFGFDVVVEVVEKLGSEILLDVAVGSEHDGRAQSNPASAPLSMIGCASR